MKTLVIPDIHTFWKKAQSIIDMFPSIDEIILLGDYFDYFDDTVEDNRQTALWLKDFISNPKHIALIGNHDIHYLNKALFKYDGFTKEKWDAINSILQSSDWEKLKVYHKSQSYLFTHAGLSGDILPYLGYTDSEKDLYRHADRAMNNMKYGRIDPLFRKGLSRGGVYGSGGIIWCDFSEFIPINNVNQIFGHTYSQEGFIGENNFCIDTNLRKVILIENKNVEIISTV